MLGTVEAHQKVYRHENANRQEATQIGICDDGTDDWSEARCATPVVGYSHSN